MNKQNDHHSSPQVVRQSRNLIDITDRAEMPRERAMRHGFASLSDREVMAILLGTGTQGKNVLDLSDEIIRDNDGHLSKIAAMTCLQMTSKYSGIGPGKALTLLAALELGKRAGRDAAEIEQSRKSVTTSAQIHSFMHHHFDGLNHEEFWILMFNRALRIVGEYCVSKGGMSATVVDVKLIVRQMLDHGAMAVALCHNHPSGNLKPSNEDDQLTNKIKQGAQLFDMRVIDHLIFSASGYYSYNDQGRL